MESHASMATARSSPHPPSLQLVCLAAMRIRLVPDHHEQLFLRGDGAAKRFAFADFKVCDVQDEVAQPDWGLSLGDQVGVVALGSSGVAATVAGRATKGGFRR